MCSEVEVFCWWKSLLGNLLAVQQERDWQNLKVKTKTVSKEAQLPLLSVFRLFFSDYLNHVHLCLHEVGITAELSGVLGCQSSVYLQLCHW